MSNAIAAIRRPALTGSGFRSFLPDPVELEVLHREVDSLRAGHSLFRIDDRGIGRALESIDDHPGVFIAQALVFDSPIAI
jgi:hypothetical protein